MAGEKIRESVIAGTWYPGHPERLTREIRAYLSRARVPDLRGRLVGLIAPHAGYIYSGPVAAHAYKLLEGKPFSRVVVLAPSHRAYFNGASIYHLGGYRTPLGVVPLDRELVDALLEKRDLFSYVPQAHAQEHSLEIQLPFLQVVLKDFRLTPILLGDVSYEDCRAIAQALTQVIGERHVLLVASTDLSHYYSYEEARRLDGRVLELVERFDPESLHAALQKRECEACGAGPMVTTLCAARALGATRARVLHYANSGDVTGDTRGVVGYMAAALVDEGGEASL
ncbi:hypothetical protein SAMN02745206_00396 [Desulfacinum infernum DSM 9756]|uniref:MEMO1 family protein SAMN02745206_00396 n=1 Tax=Desulfacinum infernum DSM 9756 TaxID=1121391 RepID=A0A1M4TW75_9BACT|nr:AmmeMemoRadiSam system protein B [Desulfacinum infernum]SHE48735.1 hypothetical protein SAMN02745206_00396 [Desulfacinum infernum DSM 9756]